MRTVRGINRAQLQRSSGLSLTAITFIETGKTQSPRWDTLEALLVSFAQAAPLTDAEVAALEAATGLSAAVIVRVNQRQDGERVVWTPARNPMLEDLTESVNRILAVLPAEMLIDILNTMAKGMEANPTNPRGEDAGPPPRINVVHGAGVQSDPSTRKARKARPAD